MKRATHPVVSCMYWVPRRSVFSPEAISDASWTLAHPDHLGRYPSRTMRSVSLAPCVPEDPTDHISTLPHDATQRWHRDYKCGIYLFIGIPFIGAPRSASLWCRWRRRSAALLICGDIIGHRHAHRVFAAFWRCFNGLVGASTRAACYHGAALEMLYKTSRSLVRCFWSIRWSMIKMRWSETGIKFWYKVERCVSAV